MTKMIWIILLSCFLAFSNAQTNCSPNCLRCPTISTCSSCAPGFFVVNQTFCAPCPVSCTNCSLGLNGMPICQACVSPAQLGPNGICFVCDNSCLTCEMIPINCTSCHDGMNLQTLNSFGTCSPSITQCPIFNCSTCSLDSRNMPVCSQCFPGFFNFKGQCLPCRFPCLNCNLDINLMWTNISQFWTDLMASNLNISALPALPPGMPSPTNVNFSNLTGEQINGWTEGYFFLRTLESFLPTTLTLGDLIAEAIALMPNIQNLSPMDQQTAVLSKFNSLIGKNLTLQMIMQRELNILQNKTLCVDCSRGFQTDLTGNCIVCPLNCAQCSAGNCLTCKIGFYLSSGLCNPCNAGCAACFGSASNCSSCIPPKLFSAGACVTCADQCSSCSPTNPTSCLTCKLPFSLYPNTTGSCYRCSQDVCLECDGTNTSICLSCRNGSSLINGRCQPCPINCISCSPFSPLTPTVCYQCSQGFLLSTVNGTCIPCGPGCLNCLSLNSCTQCQVGLYLNFTTGICQLCREGCTECSSYTNCTNFQDGIVIKDGMTIKCGPGCRQCTTDVCLVCQPRYFLSSGICNSCKPGCQICSSSTTCTKCVDNLILSAGSCLKCLGNCRTCTASNLTQCLTCIRGTVLVVDQCLTVCPVGCLNCDPANNTICLKCDQGHTLTPNAQCIKCLGSCSGTCDARNISLCLNCVNGFQLKSNQCIRCPQGCVSCLNGQCLNCAPDFRLTQNSVGVLTCVLKCKSPCSVCSGDFCSACELGFEISNGKCKPITSCNPNCEFCPQGTERTTNGSCILCPANCSSCLNGVCYQCVQGMYLKGNSCVACPSQCRTCFNNESCSRCSQGFIKQIVQMTDGVQDAVYNDRCIPCAPNCKSCIVQPDRCTSCFPGSQLLSFRCAGLFTVIYKYELNLNYTQFLANSNSQNFLQTLSNMTKVDIRDNYILSVREGSVIFNGRISANDQQNAQSIQKSLGSSVPNYNVLSSSSDVYYVENLLAKSEEQATKSADIGLIVGLSVGGVVLIAVIALGIYQIKKYRASKLEMQQTEETLGDVDNKIVNQTYAGSEGNMQGYPANNSRIVPS